MAQFLDSVMQQFALLWSHAYLPLMAVVLLLSFVLARTRQALVLQNLTLLGLFVLLHLGSAVAFVLHAGKLAGMLSSLGVLLLGVLLIRQVGLLLFRLILPWLDLNPPRILEDILILLAYIAWLLWLLAMAGLDPGSLVTSTAVITAVVAFAMQDTLGNILSGLALQLDHSVHIGDWIKLEQINGRVEQIRWRHTAVRSINGELYLIPNSQLMKGQVTLVGGPPVAQRRKTVHFYCPHDLQPSLIIATVERALQDAEFDIISPDPAPRCIITGFENGMVNYGVQFWLSDPSSPGLGASVILQHVYAVFQRQGWRMSAPGMALTMESAQDKPVTASGQPVADRVQALRRIELFSPLTEQELSELATRLKWVPYVAGSVLARQGELGESMYIVLSGRVSVWLESGDKRHWLAEINPGQVVGEMSLMTGEPRRATLIAQDDINCLALNKEDFQTILDQRPELAEVFAQLLAIRKQELVAHSTTTSVNSVQEEKAAILSRIRRFFRV